MNAKQCNYAAGSTGQFNSNPGSEVEQLETDGESRRSFLTKMIVAGAATTVSGFPYIRALAAENSTIKFGLLEDRSGNFAIFGINKWHGTQLAIKEINEGWTLEGGVQGPGGPGVFAKVATKPPTENIKETVNRGGDETEEDTVWNEEDEYLVKSGENGVLGRQIELVAPDPQSDNTQFQGLSRPLSLVEEGAWVM